MNYSISKLVLVVGVLLNICLLSVATSSSVKLSKLEKIQKHKDWILRKSIEKKMVLDGVTGEPYRRIRFETTTQSFGNEMLFVPHLKEKEEEEEEKNNDVIEQSKINSFESTTILIETGNKFAYDTINSSNNDELEENNDSLSSTAKLETVSKNIDSDINIAITEATMSTSTNKIKEINIKTLSKETTSSDLDDIKRSNSKEMDNNVIITSTTTGDKIKEPKLRTKNNQTMSSSSGKDKTLNDYEIKRFISEHMSSIKKNVTIKKSWGRWTPWSSCSRSCGEGVMAQTRECEEKVYKNGKRTNMTVIALTECIGYYKRFHICNELDCDASSVDFRRQQCSEFNEQLIRGQLYEWEPYVKDDAECELNCRPINQKYFAKLKEYAVDGTHCTNIHDKPKHHNNSMKAVCVEGKCRAVLKGGAISGSFMNSGNVRCGTSVCRPISGVFAKNPLQNGYIHVVTIPAGASNITITELRNSINFLALKSTDGEYIINGNYTVSPSGPYEVAGTSFEYHRLDGSLKATHHQKRSDGVTEWITSDGPLFEPIHLMVLSQQTNPGIKYEYLLPVTLATGSDEDNKDFDYFTSGEDNNLPLNTKLKAANAQNNSTSNGGRKKRKFLWKVIGFTPCSKSCGGGSQQPIIRCIREQPQRLFAPKRCVNLKQPVINEKLMKCNSQPCPAFWKIAEWNSCKCGEYNEESNLTREVKCVQELISGVVIQVNSGACIEDRPITTTPCDCAKPVKNSKLEVQKGKDRTTTVSQSHSVNQQDNHGKNRTSSRRNEYSKSKKSGTWLTSEWSEQCSTECGTGQQLRTIFCDRSPPNTERCDYRVTPDANRECTSNSKCIGDWFIGSWSICSGDCFNSTKSRTVVCIKDYRFAEESECNVKEKPSTFEQCLPAELTDCKPKWHFSEWTECNKPCGKGTQRRTLDCLEPNLKENVLKKSSACKYVDRPLGYRACNIHDCSESTTPYDPRVEMIQNDASCTDEFPNCNLVIKANLCGYAYYNEHCCQSCRLSSNDLF